MQTSETIGELITALAKAQGEFQAVKKSAENPFLRNRYATLDGVIDVIRGPLSRNGLAFVQPLTTAEGACWLETRIMHASGEWIATAAEIPEFNGSKGVNSLQSFGGALTYMRRYMLTSMLGINAEEDTDGTGNDGNGQKPELIESTAKAITTPSKQPEALPSGQWANIPPPSDSAALWQGQMWALIGYKHKRHVDNTIGRRKFRDAAETWAFLLQHQLDKLDEHRTADAPEPAGEDE
jgi:hypothetical protein